MKRLAQIIRLLLWGGGVSLFLGGCGNDYLFLGMEEPRPPGKIDVLFVIDNSASMVDEQLQLAESLDRMIWMLENEFGLDDFQFAVTTTTMKSAECPLGEDGKFLDRLGRVGWTGGQPSFDFAEDPSCRVVSRKNLDCLYQEDTGQGTLLVGNHGCGFRRGLAAMRKSLLTESGFLRPDAALAVVLISDGEDCGEPGEVAEALAGVGPEVCYLAALDSGPDSKSYDLSPVSNYYDFLMDLKGRREGLVKFAALTGIRDSRNPLSTTIEFQDGEVQSACVTQGCQGEYCEAKPGTRAVKLADMLGLGRNGLVSTICRNSYSESMWELGEFTACPTVFMLDEPIWNLRLAQILINDNLIPRYSCDRPGELQVCEGSWDASCSPESCVQTWTYLEPAIPADPLAPGGRIYFADHYNPCHHFSERPFRIQVIDPVD